VHLIIPSTDYEVFYLGKVADRLPTLIASAPCTALTFIDKMETYRAFKRVGLPFARSWLPSEYSGECGQIIVKPREGRGSRGLHFNPPAVDAFDDTFIVQELLTGTEITMAFYVDKMKRLHGFSTFKRALVAGMTERCQLTCAYDRPLRSIIDGMMAAFDLRGPCNVQGVVTESGDVVPFEINCRYSGTSSIRSQLGFPDVVYGVQEYLLNEEPETCAPAVRGSAVRVFLDIIYPGRDLHEIEPGKGGSFVF
jgi:carbamoyl-phosphate synthase large subunit